MSQNSTHLTNDEISQALVEPAWPHIKAHLAVCDACASEVQAAEREISQLKTSLLAQAARPESFWARQRFVIHCRIAESTQRKLRLAWAMSAMVALLLAAVFLSTLPGARPAKPSSQAQVAVQAESDDALLSNVQAELQRDVPAALEPAHLLMDQLPQVATRGATRKELKTNTSSREKGEF